MLPRPRRLPGFTKLLLPLVVVLVAIGAAVWSLRSEGVASAPASKPSDEPERLRVEVIAVHPHDPDAYTQGLLSDRGVLYESTGHYGRSTVRRVEAETGEIVAAAALSPHLFGEGLARVDDRLIQLTWREGVALIWERDTLEEIDRLRYEGEGWGLCHDGRQLVMSDGSSDLTFRDPDTLQTRRRVGVVLRGQPLAGLNELECALGWIYANVYGTDSIVRIDPESGRVTAVIDAAGLLTRDEARGADVLNGIAFDAESELFYLTGKLWPKLFAARFVPAN